jgi:cysteine-rich repeat protein
MKRNFPAPDLGLLRLWLCAVLCVALSAPITCAVAAEVQTPTPYPCVGDCHHPGVVTIDDVVTMVAIALDSVSITECDAGDHDKNHMIDVAEIMAAVNAALNGCADEATPVVTPSPTPSPTVTPQFVCGDGHIDPGEGCDDHNAVDGDGCDSHCQVEPGFQCDGEPSVCDIVGPCVGWPPPPVCSGTPARHVARTPLPQRGTNEARTPTSTPG